MPVVPLPVTDRRIALARLAIIITITAWLGYFVTWLFQDFFNRPFEGAVSRAEAVAYLLMVSLLTASSLAYLLSRLGYFYRTRKHHRPSRAILDQFFETDTPTLTTIVPSYQEDARVIRTTLLSAALQEYPATRVVLLIDDPAVPRSRVARDLLLAARRLPAEIEALLSEPASRFAAALAEFDAAHRSGRPPAIAAMTGLAAHYDAAAAWLEDLAARQEIVDHTDVFLANEVLRRLGGSFGETAAALRDAAAEGAVLGLRQLRQLFRRLIWTFAAEITSFERKRYISLSHEANKATNLNSYIGLMGGAYREASTVTGLALIPASPAACDLDIPDPDYVLTLDADSVLLPEYCLRLVHLLEQSEHRDIAIAQTPYSSFPGSATRLERIAGATTDLQHLVHQGLTYYDATFWVGANAVIRKRALDEIAVTSYIGDWEIRQYVRDRTVIEDTESTIDLGIHGWRLFNCPERLSYSATPPDFGSLCIQRRRWANGGLLIVPKLRRQQRARRSRGERSRFGEIFLRWNYLASTSGSSISLLVLLASPFNVTLISPLLGFVALPYFMALATDLRYCGYKRLDVARIYGFNLILLPVGLAGTFSSLVQGITASKSAFTRTPKVRERTVAAPFFVVSPYLLILLATAACYIAYRHHHLVNMVYAAIDVVLTSYAVVAFIGLRNSLLDAWIHVKSLLYKPATPGRRRRRKAAAATAAAVRQDWRAVLQPAPAEPVRRPAPPGPRIPEPAAEAGQGDAAGRRGRHRVTGPDAAPHGPDVAVHGRDVAADLPGHGHLAAVRPLSGVDAR